MKSLLPAFLLLAFIPSALAQAPAPKPASVLQAATDRPDALYHVGDTVEFLVTSSDLAAKSLKCELSEDGWNPRPVTSVPLAEGRGRLQVKLEKPGILQARFTRSGAPGFALAAAVCDPEKIAPSMDVPEDFDAFWSAQKAALAKVAVKFALTPVGKDAKDMEVFDVQVDCLGAPVSGYLARPKNAKAGTLPAILFVHGAGVGGSGLGVTGWAMREGGMLAMDINAHGLPNGKPAAFYDELSKGALKEYPRQGRADRETCYFRGMFLRLVRAIDFLAAQPEWDGRTLIVHGSSQGGFQALAAAGLDERVSFICAGVPAGCDHTGMMAGRISGWPKLVPLAEGKPGAAELATARYFDCVNFARRSHAKGAAVTVGFIDTTCPPTSVYAAYNALAIPKRMHTDPLAGHTNTPGASKFMQEAAMAHVREMRARP